MSLRAILKRQVINRSYFSKNKWFSTKNISVTSKSGNLELIEESDTSVISKTWSPKQMPKSSAARFETVDIAQQPNPAAAMKLISKVPVIQVHENIAACDGGGGKLGHPKIYINLVHNQKTLFLIFNILFILRIKNKQFRAHIAVYVINRNKTFMV